MKFNNTETINYINDLIDGLIFHSTLTDKPEKPFILKYQGLYFKRETRHTNTKIMHLEYRSRFSYKSKDGTFYTIIKPFLQVTNVSSFVNKRKEKRKLDIEESQFIDYIIRQLLAVLTLGQGCLDLQGILNGTAELGVNDNRTPLKIIKEQTK